MMGDFDLDYSHLCAVVAPDRILLRGNEHRITRIAFDMFRLDDDKENLWQVQADDDGNEFLVRTYELPKDDGIQSTSEWHVQEDSRKASLTVAYRGMPIHRLVAAEYGANTADEVKLLRDLVQAKLAEPEFAGRMLTSMPEPKRAALLTTFPKLAALPKIPQVSGKDPLEGIEPMDLKKEWGIDPKAKSKLPPPGDWEKHPQMVDDSNDKGKAKATTFCQLLVKGNAWVILNEMGRFCATAVADPKLDPQAKKFAQEFPTYVRQLQAGCKSGDIRGAVSGLFNAQSAFSAVLSWFKDHPEYRKMRLNFDLLDGIMEEHSQSAKDPWTERDFQVDMGRPEFREEAKTIVPKVMAYLKAHQGKKVSLQTLYMELDVNDLPLYLALHALVKGGYIQGASPYDAPSAEMAAITGESETNHGDLFYSVGESIQNADAAVRSSG
jgi:hypothetical protein